jgi:chromosome partitioning protein
MKTIAIANDKGGVGKSSVSALLIEYASYLDRPMKVIDTDPNQTIRTFLEYCSEEGRNQNDDKSDVCLIDTAGTSGANLKYINQANLVICPFRPSFADIDVLATWYQSISQEIRNRILMVPNMLGRAAEQTHCILQMKELVNEYEAGEVLTPLKLREAIYPEILKGLPQNFFQITNSRWTDAQEEAKFLCQTIFRKLQ